VSAALNCITFGATTILSIGNLPTFAPDSAMSLSASAVALSTSSVVFAVFVLSARVLIVGLMTLFSSVVMFSFDFGFIGSTGSIFSVFTSPSGLISGLTSGVG